jgi:hypothetical protein
MAANNRNKVIVSGITGNEQPVTTFKHINITGKKGSSPGQHDDIDVALIRDTKAGISNVSNVKMVGVDNTKSNAHSTSAANSGQLPTNVETEQLNENCDMK